MPRQPRANDVILRVKMVFAATLLSLVLISLGVHLAKLQLIPQEADRERLDDRRRIEVSLVAGRGNIYDCKGNQNMVALNMAVKDICVDPSVLAISNRIELVASSLSEKLKIPADELRKKMDRPDKRFAYVQRFVPESMTAPIEALKLPGVFFQEGTIRYYPQDQLMCHILGFVNHEGVGSAGIEQRLNNYLRGNPGILKSRVNGLRQEMTWLRDEYVPAEWGSDVTLNLDQNVQYIVEKALDAVMVEHHAKAAWAIVQRVGTGEILAMASRPGFNPNDFSSSDPKSRMNRNISENYEPGSTFKALTWSIALNEGLINPDQVFDCENGAWSFGGKVLRDYHPYGRLTVADGLKKSSNIMAAKISLQIGNERFYKYLRAFNISEKLGIDLPGEEKGILDNYKTWAKVKTTRVAIGQGVAATALQMVNAYCTIANDGYMMRPYVIHNVQNAQGAVLFAQSPQVLGRPLTSETAATMTRLLARVTEEGGTGTRARVDGYTVAGKTGSAQKAVAGGYSATAYIASFVGFIPAESPEVGIIVVVDEPQPLHTGGVVAGPTWSRIATETVRYLNVPPTHLAVAKTP
jgi:cell division protein FtsI (penicillin-binding protein 3)